MVKFMIDPGHGGTDSGAVGNGLQEKSLNLEISKWIRDMLLEYENTEVRLTRDTDRTVSLKQRTDMANAWGADFLLSIHINSNGGTGFESYIFPGIGGVTVTYQNVIHAEIIKEIDLRDRGKKRANFHMVRESNMPAILTENGFIDHSSDAAKLRQSSYLRRIASGHVNGLVKAFGLTKKSNGVEEPKVVERDIHVVSNWAKEEWKEATDNGYFDGSRPGATMTREEAAAVINRLRENFLRLISQNSNDIAELEARLQQIERGN